MKKQKPWNDEAGNPLNEVALKIAARTWDRKTWEQYLKSLEFTPRPDEEVSYENIQRVENRAICSLADLQPNSDDLSDELLEGVKTAINELPPRERVTVEAEFFLETRQKDIAKEFNVSRTMVRKIRKSAFTTLSKKLAKYRND